MQIQNTLAKTLAQYGLSLKGSKYINSTLQNYFDALIEKELSFGLGEEDVEKLTEKIVYEHFANDPLNNFLVVTSKEKFLKYIERDELLREQKAIVENTNIYYKNNNGGDVWGAYSAKVDKGAIAYYVKWRVLGSLFPNIKEKMGKTYKMKRLFTDQQDIEALTDKVNEIQREVEDEIMMANDLAIRVREAFAETIKRGIERKKTLEKK